MTDEPGCRLYLITPPVIDLAGFSDQLKSALDGGDVACLQLRLKDASDTEILKASEALIPVTQAYDVAFLINDRPDLAAKAGADGVHVGQEDTGIKEARRIVGPNSIVGVTCHASRHLAMEAGEAGADYVAFGAFYPTKTKAPKAQADPEILSWWAGLFEVPCVAIGGITVENASPLVNAKADFLAVSAGIWHYDEGPAAAVRAFNSLF